MTNPLSSVAHRTARWCALHPWRAILGWVAFVAFAVGLATMIPTQTTTDADYRLGESGQADAMIASADFDDPDTEQVLITARSGDLDKAEAQQAAAAVVAGMTALEPVDEVAEPQASPDGTAYLVSVTLARDQSDVGVAAGGDQGRRRRTSRSSTYASPVTSAWTTRSTTGSPTTSVRPRRSACRSP